MIIEKSLSTWFKYLNFKIVVQGNFPLYPILTQFAGILLKMKLRKLYSFRRKKDTYAITDLTFLVLFPFLFLLFNLLYWSAVHYTRYEVSQTSFITRNGDGIFNISKPLVRCKLYQSKLPSPTIYIRLD